MQVYASNIQQPWPNGADPSLKTLLSIACTLHSQQMFMNPFKYTFRSSNDASTSASPILGAPSIGPSHTTQSAMPSSPRPQQARWPIGLAVIHCCEASQQCVGPKDTKQPKRQYPANSTQTLGFAWVPHALSRRVGANHLIITSTWNSVLTSQHWQKAFKHGANAELQGQTTRMNVMNQACQSSNKRKQTQSKQKSRRVSVCRQLLSLPYSAACCT